MKNFIPILESIGLQKNSAIIYLALLEQGKSTITEITNYTSLHRVQIYRLLPFLLESGFIILSKRGKRKYYFPASPDKINEAYKEMQERNKGNIGKLLDIYGNLNKKPIITYDEGKKGITNVFNDIIDSSKTGDTFYRITSETDVEKINNEYLPKDYREKRDKKDLERYVIMSSNAAKIKRPRLEREIKIIPENTIEFKDNVLMTIYANKIAFIDFNTETSIIIENKDMADFQKKIFKLLYKSLK
ncbi:MAG: helix-turn-helix domain-containing protein [Candidatus Gracilibacteria bacterium]